MTIFYKFNDNLIFCVEESTDVDFNIEGIVYKVTNFASDTTDVNFSILTFRDSVYLKNHTETSPIIIEEDEFYKLRRDICNNLIKKCAVDPGILCKEFAYITRAYTNSGSRNFDTMLYLEKAKYEAKY